MHNRLSVSTAALGLYLGSLATLGGYGQNFPESWLVQLGDVLRICTGAAPTHLLGLFQLCKFS